MHTCTYVHNFDPKLNIMASHMHNNKKWGKCEHQLNLEPHTLDHRANSPLNVLYTCTHFMHNFDEFLIGFIHVGYITFI